MTEFLSSWSSIICRHTTRNHHFAFELFHSSGHQSYSRKRYFPYLEDTNGPKECADISKRCFHNKCNETKKYFIREEVKN